MKLKETLKKNRQLMAVYKKYKTAKIEKNAFSYTGKFENRSKNASVLMFLDVWKDFRKKIWICAL